jgi:transposase-like protein
MYAFTCNVFFSAENMSQADGLSSRRSAASEIASRVPAMSDLSSRSNRVECPRCKALMDEVVRIAPVVNETGLIAYECPVCEYVTSVLWQPKEPVAR